MTYGVAVAITNGKATGIRVTLIRDSYFVTYAQGFAEDIGAIPSEWTWPTTCIDWERAARELQMDYTSVQFNGVDVLVPLMLNINRLTPESIARLLPSSWAYSFVDINAAMYYYHPELMSEETFE